MLIFAGDCLTIGGERCLKCEYPNAHYFGGINCVPFTHHGNASGHIDACKRKGFDKKPYCQTKDAHGKQEWRDEKFKGRCPNCWWDECSNSCPIEDCTCVFPFTYDNVTHTACTTHQNDNMPERMPWCAKEVDDMGRLYGAGSVCGENCPLEEGEDLILLQLPEAAAKPAGLQTTNIFCLLVIEELCSE